MSWFFLESFAALGAALFLINFFLLVYWRRKGSALPLLIGLAVSTALLIVQAAVKTPREHAGQVLDRIEDDLERGRADALFASMSADFNTLGLDAAAFKDLVRDRLQTIRVRAIYNRRIEVKEQSATGLMVSVSYSADVTAADYSGMVPSTWLIHFVRTDDGWKIQRIDPPRLPLPAGQLQNWGALPR